jgi:hypothetical protein
MNERKSCVESISVLQVPHYIHLSGGVEESKLSIHLLLS